MCATSGSSQFSVQSLLFKFYFKFVLALLHMLSKVWWECRCNHSTRKIVVTTMNTVITDVRQIMYSVSCCWIFQSENQRDIFVRIVRILQWCVWGVLSVGILCLGVLSVGILCLGCSVCWNIVFRAFCLLAYCVWGVLSVGILCSGCSVCWHIVSRYWVIDVRRFGTVLWSILRQSNVQCWPLKMNHNTVPKIRAAFIQWLDAISHMN
jgi:nitrate reductase NapE component